LTTSLTTRVTLCLLYYNYIHHRNEEDAGSDAENAEDDDDEDKLFSSLEEVQHKEFEENAKHTTKAAPKLLQKALEAGAIDAEDEKKESESGSAESNSSANATSKAESPSKVAVEAEETEEERAHRLQGTHRANQLDFLLNKASEYSNFIAQDLEELQAQMAAEAAAKSAAAQAKGTKKRKKAGGGSTKGEEQLLKAQAKHKGSTAAAKSKGTIAIFTQPPNLAAGCILKDYQLEGVRWLTSLYENGVSGILADEMGLGKTIQVIALVAHLQTMRVTGPFMVVAPLATIPNWTREFKKWLPTLPVIRFHGTMPEREAMLRGPLNHRNRKSPSFPVIVTSYEVAIRDQAKLSKLGEFTYVVVDEGQRLKNHRCCLITSLKKIPASNRLLLSGTPIQNNLDELWSLLNFVNPQIFDDLSVFQSWFGFRDIGKMTTEDEIVQTQREQKTVSKLHDILRPFLLRRIKLDVLTDLPPKKEIVVYAGMSKLQSGYAQLIDDGTIKNLLLEQGIEDARNLSQTNKQMNHRKNSNHPFLFGEPIDSASGAHLGTAHPQLLVRASGKFALLDRMLDRLFKDGHQVLIFSQMTRVLNIMEDYLMWRNWRYCRIDGNTKIDERQRQMDVFNAEKANGKDGGRNQADDRVFCFLLSTRAGGLGINLASADTCIIFDSDWNPHQDSQAMDRCHRIGQTRPVAVYRLLSSGSVDIDMMEKQISKKKLERMAIVGGDFRRAGQRSKGEFSTSRLTALLEDDIKDLQGKGLDVEHIKISDEEFDNILDRKRLFAKGKDAIPSEGKMYDVVEGEKGDFLGSVNS
jgi:ATP-dependent DNA helicase